MLRPVKLLASSNSSQTIVRTASSKIAWPGVGQSAVGILGNPDITTHGTQVPAPTASVAKLITALVVLKAKPLLAGQQGPLITLTANDVAIYSNYLNEQGSVVPVAAGEVISEYQMLEAMLLPSANNMADSLAIWSYGSLAAYAQVANAFLVHEGLSQTHVGVDASGYDPTTTSTAHDLVLLGELALQNPIVAGIVNQPSVTGIPLTTTLKNVNSLLGTAGIIGIKTGNTNQAGGVFLSASQVVVNDKPITIVTSLATAPTLPLALKDSLPFIVSTHGNFQSQNVVQAGTVVGSYSLPWGGSAPVVATQSLDVNAWNDSPLIVSVSLQPIATTASTDAQVGTISAGQSPLLSSHGAELRLEGPVTQPSIWWRLKHPLI